MIRTPGIYPDIPMDDYVLDRLMESPTLSTGTVRDLIERSPLHAWANHPRLNPNYQADESEVADIGSIAHALLLEGDERRVEIVDAADWRTKAAREQRDAARSAGRLPILRHRMDDVRQMVEEAVRVIDSAIGKELWDSGGLREQTILFQVGDALCRARPDWVSFAASKIAHVIDYKTTTATAQPEAWARGAMTSAGGDIKAALMSRAIRSLNEGQRPTAVDVMYLVQETSPPYACSLVGLSAEYMELAEAKVDYAAKLWATCLSADSWPSYPHLVAYVDPPPWEIARWTGRMLEESLAQQPPDEEDYRIL